MDRLPLFEVMDELTEVVNTTPVERGADELVRHASLHGNILGMEALAHVLVIENARCRHAEAKYNRACMELEELREQLKSASARL